MHKELEKYRTGGNLPTRVGLMFQGREESVEVNSEELVIPLGDLITDLIKLERTPFWARKSNHNSLMEFYKATLNEITIKTWQF